MLPTVWPQSTAPSAMAQPNPALITQTEGASGHSPHTWTLPYRHVIYADGRRRNPLDDHALL